LSDQVQIRVTNHARMRLKQRVGLPKMSCQRHAERAFNKGMTHAQARGKLKWYLDTLFMKYRTAHNIRVYGQFVYLFGYRCELITVLVLPRDLK